MGLEMSSLVSSLLRTTALTHTLTLTSLFFVPNGAVNKTSGRVQRLQGQPNQGHVAIMMPRRVQVPPISGDILSNLHSQATKVVTRHIKKDLLESTLRGSFKFGTISRYRPADSAQIGRFSDYQEGLQRNVFRSRDGNYDLHIDGSSFSNVSITGHENPIVFQFEVNEYCSCSSRGGFDPERAQLIRERGNPDLDTYVVYNLEKLISILATIISESKDKRHLKLIAREVEYGAKDRHWEIEGFVSGSLDTDPLNIWLGNIFVKSRDYEHEDELRIILLDPAKAGLLPEEAEHVILNDHRIASAIIDHGHF